MGGFWGAPAQMVVKTGLAALSICVAAAFAYAQTCNTLAGGSSCGAPARGGPIDFSKPNYDPDPRDRTGPEFLTPFSGTGSIGNELSGHYAPATIGAITFGGGGARCGGLFRSGRC